MNLEEFAKSAGVRVIRHSGNSGKFAYLEAGYPYTIYSGFRTEGGAYRHWLEGMFGKRTGRTVMRLLKLTEKRCLNPGMK